MGTQVRGKVSLNSGSFWKVSVGAEFGKMEGQAGLG